MHTLSYVRFEEAIKRGFQERALSILKAKERYFTKRELKKAYEYGKSNAAILKYLLEIFADRDMIDVTENDNEIILRASEKGNKEVVELLLACEGVDPSADNNYAIRWASMNGRTEVVKLLEREY